MRVFMCCVFIGLASAASAGSPARCDVELIVLGAGQDAGAPQIGNPGDRAWREPAQRLTPTSLALVDHRRDQRYLFEATPDITEQLQRLDQLTPARGPGLGVDGIFLTHAHIGHYAGLMYLGREAAGASRIPVWAMPRLATYLERNGPWSQLVALENIALRPLRADQAQVLPGDIRVTPKRVPHRDEFSETVGFVVATAGQSFLFVPDIDSWAEWAADYGVVLEDLVTEVDHAFIDATFFDDNELPGRDMSAIPHPRVKASMARLQNLPAAQRARVRFIHYNHTNPIRDPTSEASLEVSERGFGIARAGDRLCLAETGP